MTGIGLAASKPVAAETRMADVVIVYNDQALEVSSPDKTVGELITREFGSRSDLVVDPVVDTPLRSGLRIYVRDLAPQQLDPVIAANLEAILAPPPPPTPTPAPIPAAPKLDKVEPKTYSGLATWYRHGTGMTTASRDFPRGTTLRVVAVNSGRSVDVVVNDFGPQLSTGISLDLNAPAFAELAPLGAGKISIKYYRLD